MSCSIASALPKLRSMPPVSSSVSSPFWKHSMAKEMVTPTEIVSRPSRSHMLVGGDDGTQIVDAARAAQRVDRLVLGSLGHRSRDTGLRARPSPWCSGWGRASPHGASLTRYLSRSVSPSRPAASSGIAARCQLSAGMIPEFSVTATVLIEPCIFSGPEVNGLSRSSSLRARTVCLKRAAVGQRRSLVALAHDQSLDVLRAHDGAGAAAPKRAPLVEQTGVRDLTLAGRTDAGHRQLAGGQLLADELLRGLRVEAPEMVGLMELGRTASDLDVDGLLGATGEDDHDRSRSA